MVSVLYLISVIFVHFLFLRENLPLLLSFGGDKKMKMGAHWLMVKKKGSLGDLGLKREVFLILYVFVTY